MGHINFGKNLIDRKGITDSVTLNGTTLVNWKVYNLPMDKKYIWDLRSSGKSLKRNQEFFSRAILFCQEQKGIYILTLLLMFQTTPKELFGLMDIILDVTGISDLKKDFIVLLPG